MCVDQTSLHPPPCWSLPQGWNTLPRSCSGGGLLQIRRTPALWSEEPSEVKWKLLSHVRLSATPQTIQSMEFSRPEYWSGLAFPFSRRSSQPRDCLPHCRRILYQLSHQGSPRILEWVAYPLSRGFSRPRNQTGVSCIAGGFFTNWAIREACHLVSLSITVFLMIDVLTAPMCFRGSVCLLAVCPSHESEGKWQKQEGECLETKQSGRFLFKHFLILRTFRVTIGCLPFAMATGVTSPWAGFTGTKSNSWLGCIDSLALKEFTPWHETLK